MKQVFTAVIIFSLLFMFGCSNEDDKQRANRKPKTFFWIFPDSTIREGVSRQTLHWWGEDADGVVKGYLFAMGKFTDSTGQLPSPDTIAWRFTNKTDSIVAFPLVTKQDTFDIAVRAIDNTFIFPEFAPGDTMKMQNALIRLSPFPYWDKNENGIFDENDVRLATLADAYDPVGATRPMPIRNQPPDIFFALDPNAQIEAFQQPETTFTVATFAWYGADDDGDQTISRYVIALNDTVNEAQKLTVNGNVKLITLVVPRSVSDTASSVVSADVYIGTYITPPVKIGTIGGLILNALNKFYVQAFDVAGDSSNYIGMPSATGKWYVKKPQGKLLIVNDYNSISDSVAALAFYRSTFASLSGGEFAEHEVMNIARGVSSQNKKDGRVGKNVPPFFDPALIFTLHLFDVVFWYTDMYPTLSVAQIPLFEYVHNSSHPGKVIYSTMFETSVDPSGALRDFAPIDSISNVDLVTPDRPFPTQGDSRIPGGASAYYVYPDSSDPDIFPELRFNTVPSTHLPMYIRPIFKRPDSRYIYHLQDDIRNPLRYAYGVTLYDFKSVSAIGSSAWACGQNGMMYATTDNGETWNAQTEGNGNTLNAIQMLDTNNGWAVGELGAMLKTSSGGASWSDRSLVTIANFTSLHFLNSTTGYVAGTYGTIIKTTNSGETWTTLVTGTQRTINSIKFVNENVGIAIADSGAILSTTNGGATWQSQSSQTNRLLNTISFTGGYNGYVGCATGTVLRLTSPDNGATWIVAPFTLGTNSDIFSISFVDDLNGWICGAAGIVFKTINGGTTWAAAPSSISQHLRSIAMTGLQEGWCVGSGGMLLRTTNGGTPGTGANRPWKTQPNGKIHVGIMDGQKSFVFLSVPLHRLNGAPTDQRVKNFLEHVLYQEFDLR